MSNVDPYTAVPEPPQLLAGVFYTIYAAPFKHSQIFGIPCAQAVVCFEIPAPLYGPPFPPRHIATLPRKCLAIVFKAIGALLTGGSYNRHNPHTPHSGHSAQCPQSLQSFEFSFAQKLVAWLAPVVVLRSALMSLWTASVPIFQSVNSLMYPTTSVAAATSASLRACWWPSFAPTPPPAIASVVVSHAAQSPYWRCGWRHRSSNIRRPLLSFLLILSLYRVAGPDVISAV